MSLCETLFVNAEVKDTLTSLSVQKEIGKVKTSSLCFSLEKVTIFVRNHEEMLLYYNLSPIV